LFHASVPGVLVRVENRLGGTPGPIATTGRLESWLQDGMVLGLAVEGDLNAPVFRSHRLVASTHVHDRKALMTETNRAGNPEPLVVGATVPDRVAHPAETVFLDACPRIEL